MPITLDRNLDVAVKNEVAGSALSLAPILYLDFPTLVKYYAGSLNNIHLKSNAVMPSGIYVGVGGISNLSVVEETEELKAAKLVAELNGIDSTEVALVLAEDYYARDAILGLAILDSNYKIIAEPIILFKGFISILKATIEKNAKIVVEMESILADWERPRVKRYNEDTQAEVDPTDQGFSNVARSVNKEVAWG